MSAPVLPSQPSPASLRQRLLAMPSSLNDACRTMEEAAERIQQLEDFASWIETWTANPISAYSVFAIDGLFGMTRDRIAALREKA